MEKVHDPAGRSIQAITARLIFKRRHCPFHFIFHAATFLLIVKISIWICRCHSNMMHFLPFHIGVSGTFPKRSILSRTGRRRRAGLSERFSISAYSIKKRKTGYLILLADFIITWMRIHVQEEPAKSRHGFVKSGRLFPYTAQGFVYNESSGRQGVKPALRESTTVLHRDCAVKRKGRRQNEQNI